METLIHAVPIGLGATAVMDLAALGRRRLAGTPLPDYGLVGRWLAHMRYGRFRHASIAAAATLPRERAIGWTAHYLTGIAFAGLLLAVGGRAWLEQPEPWTALLVGLVTVAAPFLLMHPGMGAGLAGRRSPNPRATRARAIVSHLTFGLGLYLAGWAYHLFL